MSADNSIAILRTVNPASGLEFVYRVAHVLVIDHFYWYEMNQPYNLGWYMLAIWGKSPVFFSASEALEYASQLKEDEEFVEYGIIIIDTDYFFPGD